MLINGLIIYEYIRAIFLRFSVSSEKTVSYFIDVTSKLSVFVTIIYNYYSGT